MSLRKVFVCIAASTATVLAAASSADASAWTMNASGANPAFGWFGGQDNTDLFESPTVNEAGFFFSPTAFRADGGGGVGNNATDFARVTVDIALSSPPGALPIDQITIQEWGTWSNGTNDPGTDFQVQADFSVFRFDPFPPGVTGALSMPVTFNPDGTWHAELTLVAGAVGNPPASDVPWQKFQITVTDTIAVVGSAPAGSFIDKTGMNIILPEPASLLLVFAGFAPLIIVRRSRQRRGR
ncbi:MAG: hypothetical protein ACE5E1_04425 [Phycisphaerae bacterium]